MKTTACNNGDIRLANGSSEREGRVEMCYDNVYGTVCDDGWGLLDAQVVCRYLNFTDAGAALYKFHNIHNYYVFVGSQFLRSMEQHTLVKVMERSFSVIFSVMEVRAQSYTVLPVLLQPIVVTTQKMPVSAVEVK